MRTSFEFAELDCAAEVCVTAARRGVMNQREIGGQRQSYQGKEDGGWAWQNPRGYSKARGAMIVTRLAFLEWLRDFLWSAAACRRFSVGYVTQYFARLTNHAAEFHDLDMLRAIVPIVAPADNDVASIQRMPVVAEKRSATSHRSTVSVGGTEDD
jgi:hypothetical protein